MKTTFRSVIIAMTLLLAVTAIGFAQEDHDFGGETVRFVSWDNREPDQGTPTYDRWLDAQEQFNVNFEYGAVGNILDETMAAVLAGDAPELVELLTNVQLVPLAVQGALHPLDEVLSDEYWESLPAPYQGRSGIKAGLEILGHSYATVSIGPLATSVAIMWNKELFEREGLPSIYELMESGEWTWERLQEIAIQATRDTTGDGEIDQWGLGGLITDPGQFAVPSLLTNNAQPVREEDGKVVVNLSDPGVLEIYQHVYDLNNVHNVVAPVPWTDLSLFAQGKVAIQIICMWQQGNAAVRDAIDVGMAYLPKGSQASDYVLPLYSVAALAVPVTAEDPQALIDLHHSIYPPEELAWLQVENYAAAQHDFESYDLIYEMAENWEVISMFTSVLNSNGLGGAFSAIVNGDQLPAEAMSAVTPQIQAALDDLLSE